MLLRHNANSGKKRLSIFYEWQGVAGTQKKNTNTGNTVIKKQKVFFFSRLRGPPLIDRHGR